MRRVVVTGMGIVSSIGNNTQEVLASLHEAKSGISRADEYARKGLQQFLCTGPKTGTPELFREHLHAHESYFASYGDSFIFRGPIRSADGADNIGTALLIELPNRAAAERFWNEEPFARNGGYQGDVRITRWVFGD